MIESPVTYEELHHRLNYNPFTGLFRWKNPLKYSNVKINDIAGYKNKMGYITIKINKKLYYAHKLAWLYVHGKWPEHEIDHKDRIRYHNWILNLIDAPHLHNMRNQGNPKNNKSGVKGVWWDNSNKNWRVTIGFYGKLIYLGTYKSLNEAICHRLAGEQCLNWEKNDSTSPAYLYVKENIQNPKCIKPFVCSLKYKNY